MQVRQDLDQFVDLFVGVGGGHLHAEAHLVLGHQRVGGHRGVLPVLEQVAPHLVDVFVRRERDLHDREPRRVGRVDPQVVQRRQQVMGHPPQIFAVGVAARAVDLQPGQRGGERGHRRGSGVQVRGSQDFERVLQPGGQRDERQQRGVGLGEPRHQHGVVVGHVEVAEEAVALDAVVVGLPGRTFADHAEPVGIIDVEQGVVLLGQAENSASSGALPVIELTPSIAIRRGRAGSLARSNSSRCSKSL